MTRTKYSEKYRDLCKKYGGNVVGSVGSALKKLDAEKNPQKIAALTEPATKALNGAIADLKPMLMDSKVANHARSFTQDLTKMSQEIQQLHKTALLEAKEGAAEDKAEEATEKAATNLTKEASTLDDALVKQAQVCSAKQKDVWTAIEKFSDKRWKAIYAFAKGFGASTNGFRGFPFAIAMMVEEVGSKEETGKGIKGSTQTVGMHGAKEESADGNKIKTQFLNYSKNEVKSELQAVLKDLDEFEKALDDAAKNADKAHALAEKAAKQVKDPKVNGESTKLKNAVEKLNDDLDKAGKSVLLLTKKLQKEGGLGEEDAEFRDAYQDIPPLAMDAVHKALQSLKAQL